MKTESSICNGKTVRLTNEAEDDCPPYLAAAMVLTLRAGNAKRLAQASRNLPRLGFTVGFPRELQTKAVRRGR